MINFYTFVSFFNLSAFLADVPLGNCVACLPGSHKFNVECSDHVMMVADPPTVLRVPIRAGDIIVLKVGLRQIISPC